MNFPRGASLSDRSALAGATPHKGAPSVAQFIWSYLQLCFWGNQKDGDCVSAEEAAAKACKTPSGSVFITEAEVIQWATAHGFLNGANLSDVLQAMKTDGFQQSVDQWDDGDALSVDWTDATALQAAIEQGPVKIAIAADQIQTTYDKAPAPSIGLLATGYTQDSNVDHCVHLSGFGTVGWLSQQLEALAPTLNIPFVPLPAGTVETVQGYVLFTWSGLLIIDVPSMLAITGEAWVRNPTTVVAPLNPPAPAPAPVDPLAALIAQVQQYGEQAVADVTAWWKKYVGSV